MFAKTVTHNSQNYGGTLGSGLTLDIMIVYCTALIEYYNVAC